MVNDVNHKRLLWANDFPHSDSTWLWSQDLLDKHAANLSADQRIDILCNNVAELYNIDVSSLPIGGDRLVTATS